MNSKKAISSFILGLFLLPLCYGIAKSFLNLVFIINLFSSTKELWTFFILGFISYIIAHFLFSKPLKIYIFGHELTHALSGIISGSSIKSFKLKKDSGSVTLSKVNLFIALSPYFIPIYTVILIIVNIIFKIPKQVFLFLTGASVAFHIALTLFAIKQGQSDLKKYGVFYSLVLVFIANCVVLGGILAIFFPVSFADFIIDSIKNTKNGVIFIWTYLTKIFLK